MRTPCEFIFHNVLPVIRRELAKELVQKQGLSQTEVAKIFGVSGSAVSQYLRPTSTTTKLENSIDFPVFAAEVASAASRIANGSEIVIETCLLCRVMRKNGMMDYFSEVYTGGKTPPCFCRDCQA